MNPDALTGFGAVRTGTLLDIEDLAFRRSASRGGFEIRLSKLVVSAGAKIALTGPSGSGKSTLLDLIGLILEPQRITRYVFSPSKGHPVDVAAVSGRTALDRLASLRRRSIGFILQQGGLIPFLSVHDNIRLCAHLGQKGRWDARSLAERLQIGELLDRFPATLSVGERQRVAVARALVHDPDLIIADEPTASLDPVTARATLALLSELTSSAGQTVLLASHDWRLVEELGFETIIPSVETNPHDDHVTSYFG